MSNKIAFDDLSYTQQTLLIWTFSPEASFETSNAVSAAMHTDGKLDIDLNVNGVDCDFLAISKRLEEGWEHMLQQKAQELFKSKLDALDGLILEAREKLDI
jgi:hypothetical protein